MLVGHGIDFNRNRIGHCSRELIGVIHLVAARPSSQN